MAIRRITISVPEATAARLKKAAGALPVSAWVTEALEEKLQEAELERRWREFYEGVAPTREDKKRASVVFRRLVKSRRRSAA